MMKAIKMHEMFKATRLTGAGRLADATALLRGLMSDAARKAAPGQGETGPKRPVIDMTPPRDGKGAWTTGRDEAGAAADLFAGLASRFGDLRGKAEPLAGGQMPQAVRDLLGRLGSLKGMPAGLGKPFGEPAPQPLPPGARFEERLYADAHGERAYKLYVPSGYDGQPLPLVVMLHGCTQSPDDFAAGTQMNQLAEERNVLVAYPAQAQSANASKCWNWFNAADQKRDSGEPALIAGITRQIMRDFAVDSGRVYVAGLSAGGAAAAIMGAVYPELYAAIGIHSGLACGAARDMPSAFAAMRQGGGIAARAARGAPGRPVRVIVFHGDQDKTVNPVNGDQVMAQFREPSGARAIEVTRGESPGGMAFTRHVQADPDGTPVFEQWLIHGAAHAWSGGSTNGSYTEPRGPDASREMLRFFLDHGHEKAPAVPAQET